MTLFMLSCKYRVSVSGSQFLTHTPKEMPENGMVESVSLDIMEI